MEIDDARIDTQQVGFTRFGFYPKRLSVVIEEMQKRYRQYLGDDIRIDENSILGNIIAPESLEIADLWELVEQATHTLDARYAQDIALDNLALLVGVSRQEAEKSTVVFELKGDAGTVVPKGTSLRDTSNQYWETSVTTVIEANGEVLVNGESEKFGAIHALPNTITQILDSVQGLASANNPLQAVIGRQAETDSELRGRIYGNSTAKGVGHYRALLTSLQDLDGVTYVRVIENDTMTDTSLPNIIKAKSFQVVIAGGDTQDIGNQIWYHKPVGISTNGTTGVDVEDLNGDKHNIYFQRPTDINIYLEIEITPTEGVTWSGAFTSSIIQNILKQAEDELTVGTDVVNSRIYTPINEVGGCSVNFIKQGKTANPTSSDDIAINEIERAIFDETRISVVVV